jgi:hypothetical protein
MVRLDGDVPVGMLLLTKTKAWVSQSNTRETASFSDIILMRCIVHANGFDENK